MGGTYGCSQIHYFALFAVHLNTKLVLQNIEVITFSA